MIYQHDPQSLVIGNDKASPDCHVTQMAEEETRFPLGRGHFHKPAS